MKKLSLGAAFLACLVIPSISHALVVSIEYLHATDNPTRACAFMPAIPVGELCTGTDDCVDGAYCMSVDGEPSTCMTDEQVMELDSEETQYWMTYYGGSFDDLGINCSAW